MILSIVYFSLYSPVGAYCLSFFLQTNNFDFSIYSPNTSSTSKNVPCTSNLCAAQNECTGGANSCPYTVEYVSNNTSSSGVLVEDVMYLTTEDGQHEVDAQITFG